MPIANAAPATTVADPVTTLYHKINKKEEMVKTFLFSMGFNSIRNI